MINDKDFIDVVVGWDINSWSPVLDYWKSAIKDEPRGKVLEIGCGPGGLSMWLAELGYDVTCSDIELPGDAVRSLHQKYGYKNIEYAQVDALTKSAIAQTGDPFADRVWVETHLRGDVGGVRRFVF